MTGQLALFSGLPPEPRQQPSAGGQQAEGGEYPAGWSPLALPEPAATAVRDEPALAWIAAGVTVHRLHGAENTVARGRAAGIAYLIHRAQQAVIAAAWAAAQDFGRHSAGDTGGVRP